MQKSGASSSSRKLPNVQPPPLIAFSSETQINASPSHPVPSSMRAPATTCRASQPLLIGLDCGDCMRPIATWMVGCAAR